MDFLEWGSNALISISSEVSSCSSEVPCDKAVRSQETLPSAFCILLTSPPLQWRHISVMVSGITVSLTVCSITCYLAVNKIHRTVSIPFGDFWMCKYTSSDLCNSNHLFWWNFGESTTSRNLFNSCLGDARYAHDANLFCTKPFIDWIVFAEIFLNLLLESLV